jgi:hypothetical protein
MRKTSLAYSGLLLLVLVLASVALNKDVVRGLTSNTHVTLSTTESTHVLGQDVVFNGTLIFANNETATVGELVLANTSGTQAFSVSLPIYDTDGSYIDLSDDVTGSLSVKIAFDNIVEDNAGSTVPDGTLPGGPGGTLPGSGDFTAGSAGGTITVEAIWTPPVFLDPVPNLTLIPSYDTYFALPTLTEPTDVVGTKLPDSGYAWAGGAIPTAGVTSGTALPDSTSTVAIPQITLTTNAPSSLPGIPDTTGYMGTGATSSSTGFTIPSLTAVTSTAASFPSATDSFVIPSPTISTSTVTGFGSGADYVFTVPDGVGATSTQQIVKGMTHDGTDYWFILAGASNDMIIKVDGGTFITTASTTAPSASIDGIAAVGSGLYVVENKHRCSDEIETGNDCKQSRIFKIASSASLPTSSDDSSWAAGTANAVTAILHAGEQHHQFAGLAPGGSGDLWTVDQDGQEFYNLYASGIEKDSNQGEWTQANAIAFSSNLIYTAKGSAITQWTDAGSKIQDVTATNAVGGSTLSGIKSLAFDGNTMYFVSNDDGKLYATFVGSSVTSPIASKGISYSTISTESALWILVEGSPKDYVLKVNPTSGALITNFSSDGWAQAPSADTEGIEYFDGYLYIIANEGSGCCDSQRQLYKVNATTGNTESGYPKNMQDSGVHDDLGDITNNGTDLVAWTKSNWNDVYIFDGAVSNVNQNWVNGVNWNGAKALAYHPTQKSYYAASGNEVSQLGTSFDQISSSVLAVAGGGTAITSVQGMTFSDAAPYNDLWTVAGTRVYHSYIAATVTNQPVAMAYSPDSITSLGSTESLWVVVDAQPFDQILRINTSDGALNATFDSDGIADAPSGNIEGAVFISEGNDNFLYMVANDPGSDNWNKTKNLYKYNVKTRALATGYPKNLENAQIWDDVGGLAYDGTDLIVTAKQMSNVWKVSTTGDPRGEGWPCCAAVFGITGLAYHSTRGVLYGAGATTLVGISSDLNSYTSDQTIQLNSSAMSGSVGAMTFGSDVLYVGRTESSTGYITASAFSSSITTIPQGLALSPSTAAYLGTSVGAALWIAVDGSPFDRVIKVNPSTLVADTGFGSDATKNGSAEMPAQTITGIAFADNALWAVGTANYEATLWKLNPVTGAELNSYNLCNTGGGGGHGGGGGGGGGGNSMCQNPGGMTYDGSELIITASDEERFWYVNLSGQVQRESMSQNALGGANSLELIQSDKTYLTGYNQKVQTWTNPFGNDIWPADSYVLTGGLANVKGMVLNQTTKNIYIGWNDGSDGYISQAVPPSPITNTPVDLAYNGDDGELYVLVDGKGGDVVIAVNPTTGAILLTDAGAERFFTLQSENSKALAYHKGNIYAVYEDRGFMMSGPPPQKVTVLTTAFVETGDSGFNLGSDMGNVLGLASDGSDLVGTSAHGGPRADTYHETSGNRMKEIHFYNPTDMGWHQEGFEDIAVSTSTPMYFPVKYGDVYRVDEGGAIVDSWAVQDPEGSPAGSLVGIAFVGDSLYLADANNDKVYKALVPLPTTVYTTEPRALASDGSSLWVALDAEPVDLIVKMAISTTTATVINSFDSPGTETDGLAIHDGKLWVLINDTQTIEMDTGGGGMMAMQVTVSQIVSLNKDSGVELSEGYLMMDSGYGGPDVFKMLAAGLASDGTFLYSGAKGSGGMGGGSQNGEIYKIDPTNLRYKNMMGDTIGGPVMTQTNQFAGAFTPVNAFTAFTFASDSAFPADRKLIAAGASGFGDLADKVSRLDVASGVLKDQYTIGSTDIKGLALVGTTLFMADAATDSIIGTALPENTGVEMTVVGPYAASLSAAITGGSTYSASASYAIVRNTNVAVQLTSPLTNFVATTTSTTIAGRVSDPSVASVNVGIQLPFTEFLNDTVLTDGTSAAMWTTAMQNGGGEGVKWFIASGGGCPVCNPSAWRFGKPGAKNFDVPNERVTGTLTSVEAFPVAIGSQLTFDTAWDTEFMPDLDMKLVQVATITQDLQGNDVVGSFKTIGQIVQFVDPMGMPPGEDPHPSLFQWITSTPLPFAPGISHPVSIPLDVFAGQRIKMRFKFDSGDEWGNEGFGWFVDNITLSGSGTKTISIATTPLATPIVATVNGTSTTLYASFSTQFALAEGENTVVATAVQPYSPQLSGFATTAGFVDTKAPVITLSGLPANTNVVFQTLTGTLIEPTINQPGAGMTFTQNLTSPSGATSSVVIGKVTQQGPFSLGISLQEGTNTFVAEATDGGGIKATQQIVAIADLTPPTAKVGIVTVTSEGEAIVGDQYFVLVAATDALSGVATSTLLSTGATMLPLGETPATLRAMHALGSMESVTTTHVTLASVESNTPVAFHDILVRVSDKAGNTITVTGQLNVVAARSNRNYFLFPGNNFMGLALIPDDGDDATTDDASLDRLMLQDVTDQVNPDFRALQGATSTITLGDVVESTFAFNKAGNFVVHTPGDGAADTLTELNPFQGMILKTKEKTVSTPVTDIFNKVDVEGFSAQQAVPIRINIQGVFSPTGASIPPNVELRVGFNLVAPHILGDTDFKTVLRGALIPRELAISALTFERRVDAVADTGISVEIFEGFVSNSLGDALKPTLSYWTFIVDDPQNDLVNDLGDQLGPTITP